MLDSVGPRKRRAARQAVSGAFPSLCRMAARPYPAHLPLLQRKHRVSRGFPAASPEPPSPHNETVVYCLL
ncbi:hypothetical protein DJ520_19700 [Klebsiella quasipneumoniae]|nr:hypothetical protein DJ520_19700 [Klebsiella quasipneumoniae]